MVGQHIFVRCRNEQNNAGTWTAAITENLVDKEIVRNLIEPRGNMDEAFAQRTLLACPDNSVLRMYHIGDNIMVVSRTYWVTDRITETMGRKGAYSISYILTDEDVVRFSNDFGGAFDDACFERYDALVERTKQGRITINPQYNLFAHRDGGYDPAVFSDAGLTKESFVQLMNGLYAALENRQQLAVLLPAALRRAWETDGDRSAEKLAYHILCLLPDFTRAQVGIASHWSCQVKDKMVSDMQLVFVHPEKEEDLAYLKREGVMLLDLDGGKHTSGIPASATAYFSFLWDSLRTKESIEAFWAETRAKYRKLLRGKPCSARAMESVYLMSLVTEENFSDAERLRRAFLLAAVEFAGAGTRVPAAEEFLQRAIRTLRLTRAKPDAALTAALCTMMRRDGEQTKHQAQEYEALLHACACGAATDETVEALCDEVNKTGRDAGTYYLGYLKDKRDTPAEKLTLQMAQFVCGLFVRLFTRPAGDELLCAVVDVMRQWAENALARTDAAAPALQQQFADAYAAYLSNKGANAETRRMAYDFLFAYEQKAEPQQREKCAAALFREEKRLYKSMAGDGAAALRLFAASFFGALPPITQMKKDTAVTCYQRLFRLAYTGDGEVFGAALSVYRAAIAAAGEGDLAARIVPVLLHCEEETLAQIEGAAEIWTPLRVGKVLLMFEMVNVSDLSQYAPGDERVRTLMKWYSAEDSNTYVASLFYLRKMQFGERQVIYKNMQAHGLLQNMFLYVLFVEKNEDIRAEIEKNLDIDHFRVLELMMKPGFLDRVDYDDTGAADSFAGWYEAALKQALAAAAGENFGALCDRIVREYRALRGMPAHPNGFRDIAKEILDGEAYTVLDGATDAGIVALAPEVIREIVMSIEASAGAEPRSARTFRLVARLDEIVSAWKFQEVDAACATVHAGEDREISCRRLQYYIQHAANEERAQVLWLYAYLLHDSNVFRVGDYLKSAGLASRSELDTGVFLAELLNQLSFIRSPFEPVVGTAVMRYLCERISQNPQAYADDAFLSRMRFHGKEYYRASGIDPLLRRIKSDKDFRFDARMFLLCLLGTVAVLCLVVPIAWLLIVLGRINAAIMLSAGIFILMILVALIFFFLPQGGSEKRRESDRRIY